MANGDFPSDHLLPLYTRAQVAELFKLPLKKLNFWLYALHPSKRYQTFELRRRSGTKTRIIHAPIKPIKDIQVVLAKKLTQFYQPPAHVHGYVSDRSILSNAEIHKRQHWILQVDLKDFFPSIHFGRVRGLFMKPPFGYSPEIATLLAHICCYEDQLPHGAPTSPVLSNLICRSLDRHLSRLARAEYCYYSRYSDDLVFSTSRHSFPKALAITDRQTGAIVAGEALRETIQDQGFKINPNKTKLRHRSQQQMVTGIVTNEFPNIPRHYVRSVRNLLYIWKRYGEVAAEARFKRKDLKNRPPGKPLPLFHRIVRGQVQYIGFVKGWRSPAYRALAKQLSELDDGFTPTIRDSERPPMTFRLFAEGKTDYLHLRAALKFFRDQELFAKIDFDFRADIGDGDKDLLRRCKDLSSVHHNVSCIFVFDGDNDSVTKEVNDSEGFKNWGNNVFSFSIPTPAHRQVDEKLCIELLYTNEVLELTDGEGRRIFQKDEFDASNALHKNGNAYCLNTSSKTLIVEKVIDVKSGKNIALSKNVFANKVLKKEAPYQAVEFEGFRRVFETICKIRNFMLSNP